MILRRITEHVKTQNWFAIGIDFGIVVVGVFIGIQVSNWNETLSERKRETQILQNIATDLRTDIAGYSRSIEGTLNKIAAITYVIENVSADEKRDESESFSVGAWGYDDYFTASPELATRGLPERAESFRDELWTTSVLVSNAQPSPTAFDSLVAAGELGILRNANLVRQLQEYRFVTMALEKAQDTTYRPRRDNAIDIGQLYGLPAFGRVDEELFLNLVEATPQLAAVVESQLGWAKGHFVMLSVAKENARDLINQIENEMDVPRSVGTESSQ